MADCQSLRDICKGLQGIRGGLNHLGIQKAPSRNALSHQNAKRDAMVFRDIYRLLHIRSSGGIGTAEESALWCDCVRISSLSAKAHSPPKFTQIWIQGLRKSLFWESLGIISACVPRKNLWDTCALRAGMATKHLTFFPSVLDSLRLPETNCSYIR